MCDTRSGVGHLCESVKFLCGKLHPSKWATGYWHARLLNKVWGACHFSGSRCDSPGGVRNGRLLNEDRKSEGACSTRDVAQHGVSERHSQQALASAQQSPFAVAQPPGYRSTPPTPVPGAIRGRCLGFGTWKQESGPDHMTSLTAGRKGSSPACVPQAKHSSIPPLSFLFPMAYIFKSQHMPSLSSSWSMADISDQT